MFTIKYWIFELDKAYFLTSHNYSCQKFIMVYNIHKLFFSVGQTRFKIPKKIFFQKQRRQNIAWDR